MRTKQKTTIKEIYDYFKNTQEKWMLEQIEEGKYKEIYGNKTAKFPYRFVPNDLDNLWFLGHIIDIAVFDFAQMKFTEIHYPWRKKKGDIVYKVINLEQYEKESNHS
jgi:hypothetical protein